MIKSVAQRLSTADALPVLGAYAVVLLAIPSELIVRPLGAAGTPAQIIGIGLLGWWMASRLLTRPAQTRANPVKWVLLLFVLALLASYVAGMSRPLTYGEEVSSADRTLLSLCAWCGVALVLMDGITSMARLERLLRIVAGGATVIAILGMLQFFFHLDLAHIIHIPGLSANHSFGQLLARSAYQRVSGTASHPIEFGVVLSAALPLVIHFARFSETRMQRRRWWIATTIVGIALPLSVARSAILGALIVVLYLYHTWPSRLRLRMLVAGGIGAVAMSFAVPGLLGTIKGLFLNASSDPSTQGRAADYAPVIRYTGEHPVFGRGFGTFIPSLYRTLDNQYLGILVEAGIVGLLALLVLFFGTGFTAGALRRRSSSESERDLAQGLKAGVGALAVNYATFDGFGFSMCAGMTFLLIGATGAMWSIKAAAQPASAKTRTVSTRWLIAAGVVLTVLVGAGAKGVVDAQPEYQAYGTSLLTPPQQVDKPAFGAAGNADNMASVLHDVLVSDPIRQKLGARSATDYEVALGNGSLEMDSDVLGTGGPTLRFLAVGPNQTVANATLAEVMREARSQLQSIQAQLQLSAPDQIQMETLQQAAAFPVSGRPSRAHIVFVILLLLVLVAYLQIVRRRQRPQGLHAGGRSARPVPSMRPQTTGSAS